MSKKEFIKVAKPVVKDPVIRQLDNEYLTHPKSKAYFKDYEGFKVQIPEENEDNHVRGTHITEILDDMFEVLKWVLYRHNKVTVMRYDFYPADSEITISDFHHSLTKKLAKLRRHKDKTISTKDKKKGDAIFKDLKYLWVREKGTAEVGGGIHYHCFVVFRTPTRMTQLQVNELFREKASDSLKGLVKTKLDKENFANRKRHKKLLETYLDDIAPFKDFDKKYKAPCPYVTIPGYFWLRREMLHLEKSYAQKEDIEKALANLKDNETEDKGYLFLRINVIKKREHFKALPVGGVLEECIYGLSYIAKTVTKHALPDNNKMCGKSQLRHVKTNQKRENEIAEGKKIVDKCFEEYKRTYSDREKECSS